MGLPELLALPRCSFRCGLWPLLLSQDAKLQVGAELTHGLTQPGYEQNQTEVGKTGLR